MGHSNTGHQPGATHEALPLDPENDIDAKSATWWVVGGTVVLFLSLWVMVPIFLRVQDEEHMKKINNLPNEEYNDVKAHELEFLHGANPQKRSIEDVMAKMASGK
jgi:hypothetical protein